MTKKEIKEFESQVKLGDIVSLRTSRFEGSVIGEVQKIKDSIVSVKTLETEGFLEELFKDRYIDVNLAQVYYWAELQLN